MVSGGGGPVEVDPDLLPQDRAELLGAILDAIGRFLVLRRCTRPVARPVARPITENLRLAKKIT